MSIQRSIFEITRKTCLQKLKSLEKRDLIKSYCIIISYVHAYLSGFHRWTSLQISYRAAERPKWEKKLESIKSISSI